MDDNSSVRGIMKGSVISGILISDLTFSLVKVLVMFLVVIKPLSHV